MLLPREAMTTVEDENGSRSRNPSRSSSSVSLYHLSIPAAEATVENLAYYGCRLVSTATTDTISFDRDMPISRMQVGKNYVRDFVLGASNSDPALYLEWHGAAHFHAPLSKDGCSGYLVVGKRVFDADADKDNGKRDACPFTLRLSRFAIPYGYGIVTPGGVVHCDATLIGDYLVAYTLADDYETYLVKAAGEGGGNVGGLVRF